ncbi:MAG: hypothetical protein HON94_10240 [Methylococcales bacterium]|nr:hypothetical protein [Methylococcales bacterium]MBT7409346.1 hypothetical protein [Methylococcales bacterium]
MKKFAIFIGVIITIFSSFFIIAAMSDLMSPEDSKTEVGIMWGILVFFMLTLSAGLYLIVANVKKGRRQNLEASERQLLELIAQHHGKVTSSDIALNTHMTLQEAEDSLKALCQNGKGEIQLTKEGKMLYVFFGFISDEEKQTSKNVMEF